MRATEYVDSVPDSAMPVDHGLSTDHENYVMFRCTDVIEWYTVYERGDIKRERFVAADPDEPEDIPIAFE